jgi:hypothetical protein
MSALELADTVLPVDPEASGMLETVDARLG